MAGGRRPASYVAGARHNTGVDRQPQVERPVSPMVHSVNNASLPLWIPSIWQPQPNNSTQTKDVGATSSFADRPAALDGDASSALAAALDSAVQSAVVRALGTSSATTSAPSNPNSALSQDSALDDGHNSPVKPTPREQQLSDIVEDLRARLAQRDEDFKRMASRMDQMERNMMEAENSTRLQDTTAANLTAQTTSLSNLVKAISGKLESQITSLNDRLRTNVSIASQVRDSQADAEGDISALSRRTREMSSQIEKVRSNMSAEFEECRTKTTQHEKNVRESLQKLEAQVTRRGFGKADELEPLKRNIEGANEGIASLRSRLKKTESSVAEVSKQANDSVALRNGFEESTKEALDDAKGMINALHIETRRLRGDMVNNGVGVASGETLRTRVSALEGSLKTLKKLIESNLRTQWSAEGIVKEQVSLITKHVCVAMRQYTARRISENNALIDKALRARIPEYSQSDDQFVLVREEDLEGNGNVDIQKSTNAVSPKS